MNLSMVLVLFILLVIVMRVCLPASSPEVTTLATQGFDIINSSSHLFTLAVVFGDTGRPTPCCALPSRSEHRFEVTERDFSGSSAYAGYQSVLGPSFSFTMNVPARYPWFPSPSIDNIVTKGGITTSKTNTTLTILDASQ